MRCEGTYGFRPRWCSDGGSPRVSVEAAEYQKREGKNERPACAGDYLGHHVPADYLFSSALGLLVHESGESRLAAECQSRQRIHYEVYPQYLDNGQRVVNSDERADEADENRRNVDGELEYNELPDGVEDGSAVEDSAVDGVEVVVQDNDIGRFLCDFRAAAHCEAYVRLLERRGIVDAVAGHARNEVKLLGKAHQTALV